MPRAIALRERPPGLMRQRCEQQPLVGGRTVPQVAEVRVLGAQELRERVVELLLARRLAGRRLGPQEITELLRRVGMAARDLQDAVDDLVGDLPAVQAKAVVDERLKLLGLDRAQLDAL